MPVEILRLPVAVALEPVKPRTNLSALSSKPINPLDWMPLLIKIPESLIGSPEVPLPTSIKLSVTSRFVALTVVVVPLTVSPPLIVAPPVIVAPCPTVSIPTTLVVCDAAPTDVTPANVVITGCDELVTDTAVPVVFWLPVTFTPGKLISAVPLNATPPIKRSVVSLAAESTLIIPVVVPLITKLETVVVPLTVKFWATVSDPEFVTVSPLVPIEVKPVSVEIVGCEPFDTVAAEPDVFWVPEVLTPGKLISAEPLNPTPPIRRGFASMVAVSALPVTSPTNFLPVARLISFADVVLVVSDVKCCVLASNASMLLWTSPDKFLRWANLLVANDCALFAGSTTLIAADVMLNFEVPEESSISNFSLLRTVTGPLTSTNPWI